MSEDTSRLSAALADRYRIQGRLGEGGMATVYLAEDLKHKRKVALKVLRPELAAVLGAERFVQEITTTASLQHQNILPLFDSGQTGGFLYYVMPYVEGETLREKLNRETQLSIEEAVKITTEVLDALDYAHRHGVIHRDIKPENILLHDGRPMVADFGIALAVSAAAGGRMTETGLSLGTPHYMSPEQATAEKDITGRSDIYSVGSVLYEMLTGEPPHTGGSAQHIIMKIVTDTARPVTELRKSVPPNVTAAVTKALEKLAADRFESAAKFAEALANPGFTLPTTHAAAVAGRAGARWNRLSVAGWSLAAAMTAVAAWGWLQGSSSPPPSVTRVSVRLPRGEDLAGQAYYDLSHDGSMMVYVGEGEGGTGQLWLRRWSALEATPVSGTEGALGPAVSPNGQSVAFWSGGALRVAPLQGGVPRTIVADSFRCCIRWSPAGDWLYYANAGGGLSRVRPDGGTPDVLTRPDSLDAFRDTWPNPLPGGKGVTFLRNDSMGASIYALDLQTRESKALLVGFISRYSSGYLFYLAADGTTLMAAPFDPAHLALKGQAIPVVEGLLREAPGFSVSQTGRLLYRAGVPLLSDYEAVRVSREGQVTAIDPDWTFDPGTNNRGLSLSPDGTHLAVSMQKDGNLDVWVKELPRGPVLRLTADPAQDVRPRWTPDGRSVLFLSDRDGTAAVFEKAASGTGAARLLAATQAQLWEAQYSPDREWLVVRTGGQQQAAGNRDVWVMRPGVDTALSPLIVTSFDEKAIALSPDGRWLALESDETGRNEVYVYPFPDVNADKVPVSTAGGTMPVWAHSGRELFYVNGDRALIAAQVVAGTRFSVSERRVLFTLDPSILYRPNEQYALYDVASDDQHFVMLGAVQAQTEGPELILVDNVIQELKGTGGN